MSPRIGPRIGIVGASGYSGILAARILAAHPSCELACATSDRWAGESVRARAGADTTLTFVTHEEAFAAGLDAVLLATSAEVSITLAPRFLAQGVKVVDLSGAFRLRDAQAYPRWYRFDHAAPELLSKSHYGLPELFPGKVDALVANPGCYATAAILSLAPLARAGLLDLDAPLIVDGKSGVTGAGRQAKDEYSFVEVDDDVRAYKLHAHQHTPEMSQAIGDVAGRGVSLTFAAHLIPVRRGLLCTSYVRPRVGVTTAALRTCLEEAYRDAPFVEVVHPHEVRLASVVGTNVCRVGVLAPDLAIPDIHDSSSNDAPVVVVVAALDNLIKGAAGQAVQNLNRLLGFAESTGLDRLFRSTP